jgi:hypothetical protein
MSYKTQGEIADNRMMQVRVAQAYASEPETKEDPDKWTWDRRRDWAAAPGWDTAWESYKASHPSVEGEPDADPGADEGVITDAMILSQVQSMQISDDPPGQQVG